MRESRRKRGDERREVRESKDKRTEVRERRGDERRKRNERR